MYKEMYIAYDLVTFEPNYDLVEGEEFRFRSCDLNFHRSKRCPSKNVHLKEGNSAPKRTFFTGQLLQSVKRHGESTCI